MATAEIQRPRAKPRKKNGKKEECKLISILDSITCGEPESLDEDKAAHVKQFKGLLSMPNMLGVGITEKATKAKNKPKKLAITFYVEKKIPLGKLKGNEVVPPAIPESLSGEEAVPTDVVALGKLRLDNKPYATRNPIQPGNSISHFRGTAGTLGAIVTNGKKQLLLSNSHVLAKSGNAKKGDAVVYPGKHDGGKTPHDVVGRLSRVIQFKKDDDFTNEVDCAVAEIVPNGRKVLSVIRGVNGPKGIIAPRRGMKIKISGRTSGINTGQIKDIHFRFSIKYPDLGKFVGFKNQILCTRYSDSGDSGSLVLEKTSGKAVGLHFASAKGGSVCNPIQKVLKSLRVKLGDMSLRRKDSKN